MFASSIPEHLPFRSHLPCPWLNSSTSSTKDVQREWRAHGLWNLQWFKDHLGQKRQLLKWLGPVFTRCLATALMTIIVISLPYFNVFHALSHLILSGVMESLLVVPRLQVGTFVRSGQECLWEAPVYETTVQEYIDYMHELEKKDPDCEEQNAAQCPRSSGKSFRRRKRVRFCRFTIL